MNKVNDDSLAAEEAADALLTTPIDLKAPDVGDTELLSVTSIIASLDKPALVGWAAKETALAAVRQAASLQRRIQEDGPDEVVKSLAAARFRRPQGERSAGELGTAVHAAIEEYALTGVKPMVDAEVRPFMTQWDRWAQVAQPVFVAVESTVYNETYGYAGTLDAIMELAGQRVITDWKTSKKSFDAKGKPTGPYPEVGLQLAAYRNAEVVAAWRPRRYEKFRRRIYLLGQEEREVAVPMPEVDGTVVVHVSPEHCVAYPVRTDDAVFDSFLFALEVTRWQRDVAPTVIGQPLEFSHTTNQQQGA